NAEAHAILEWPEQPRGGKAEGARAGQNDHLIGWKVTGEQSADAVAQRIAARQHDDAPAAPTRDLGERVAERAFPSEGFSLAFRHQRQMTRAADDQLRMADESFRRAGKSLPALLSKPDDRKPHAHDLASSALTAAAASALPPRRPDSAI